jgi:hypothetical protein
LPNLTGMSFTKSAEYGTVALMEGPPPKNLPRGTPRGVVSGALFILDRDRHYRFVSAAVELPQVGTKPSAAAVDGGRNARAVLAAIRAKDCAKFAPLIHPDASQAIQFRSPRAKCKALVNGALFPPSLRATPNAKPVLLGQTRDYALYGVATKASYFTLVMSTPPGTSDKPPIFFGVFLNTSNPRLPKQAAR